MDPKETQIADWKESDFMEAVENYISEIRNIEILNLPDPKVAEKVPQLRNEEKLQKLKQLNTVVHKASDLKMALSNCRQMEILRAQINEEVAVSDFADVFKSANIRELQ